MALESSLVPVLFDKALDQKNNYKVQLPGTFLALQNVVRRKSALWEKRYGTTALSGTFANAKTIAQFNNDLVLADGEEIKVFSSSANAFQTPTNNALVPIQFSRQAAYRTPSGAGAQDVAYCNGYTCAVFGDSYESCNLFAVFESATGTMVVPPTSMHALGGGLFSPPRVIAVGTKFVFLFTEGDSEIHIGSFETTTLSSVASGILASDGSGIFEVCLIDNSTIAVAYNNATNGTTVAVWNLTAGKGTGSNGYPAPVSITTSSAYGLSCNAAFGFLFVFFAGSTDTALHAWILSTTTLVTETTTSLDTGLATQYYSASTSVVTDAVGHVLTVFYNFPQSYASSGVGTVAWSVKKTTITWNGGTSFTQGATFVDAYGVALGSKALIAADGHSYCIYSYGGGALQDCYYLVQNDEGAVAVSRFASGTASAFPTQYQGPGNPSSILPSIVADNQGRCAVALLVSTPATSNLAGLPGASSLSFGVDIYYFAPGGSFSKTNLGNGLQLTAGLVSHFDGSKVYEHGFHTYPENFVITTATTGGSLMASTTYNFKVMWEWIDAQGLIHRSAPSITQSKTTGATATNTITVNIPPLPFSQKVDPLNLNGVRAVVYVGYQGDAAIFYRHGSVMFERSGRSGTPQGYTIDAEPNTTAEVVYTTGNNLDNIAPPACNVAHVHKNRLWIGGLESSIVWFSKEFTQGLGVSFTDAFFIEVEDDGGPVTAFATLDDKLIIFKKDRIYYLVGNGPTDDGNNWDYSEPQRIPSDTGTLLPNTVVTTPSGVLFKSPKGWYLLSRAFQVEYIGASVEDFNSLTACSATVLSDENEVRLVHSDGGCLVYNYYFNQWSAFTNYEGYDSCIAGTGTYYRLGVDGKVHKEVVGQYNDDGAKYSIAVETSWLSLAKLQGYQRVYALQLLADFVDDHQLEVQIAYDFQNAYNQTVNFTTTGVISGTVLQLRIQPAIQKCTAIKLRIVDNDTVSPSGGASLKPTSLAVEVGRKRGAARLPPAQSL